MHSSGMRTARLLTVSQHALSPEGCTCLGGYLPGGYTGLGVVPAWGCVYLSEGVPARSVYLPGGTCPGVYLPRYSPPVDRHCDWRNRGCERLPCLLGYIKTYVTSFTGRIHIKALAPFPLTTVLLKNCKSRY